MTTLRENCDNALAALDRTLKSPPGEVEHGLEQALCSIVALRNALIEQKRAAPARSEETLKKVNALLSIVWGTEYPVAGIRKDHVRQAREALAAVAPELETKKV